MRVRRFFRLLLVLLLAACSGHQPDCRWEIVATYQISVSENDTATIAADVTVYSTPKDVRTPGLTILVNDESGSCTLTGSGNGYAVYKCFVSVPTASSYTVKFTVCDIFTDDAIIDADNNASRHVVDTD